MNYFEQASKLQDGQPTDGRFMRNQMARRIARRLHGPCGDTEATEILRMLTNYRALIENDPSRLERLTDQFNARFCKYRYDRY